MPVSSALHLGYSCISTGHALLGLALMTHAYQPREPIKLHFQDQLNAHASNLFSFRAPSSFHECKLPDIDAASCPIEWLQQALLSFGTASVGPDLLHEEEWYLDDPGVQVNSAFVLGLRHFGEDVLLDAGRS